MAEEHIINLQLRVRLEEAGARLSRSRELSAGRSFVDHWSVRLAPEGRAEEHRFQGARFDDLLPRNTEPSSLDKKST
jgi:hypothetical protein